MTALGVSCLLLMSLSISVTCSASDNNIDSLLPFQDLPNFYFKATKSYSAAEKGQEPASNTLQEFQIHPVNVLRRKSSQTTATDRKNTQLERREASWSESGSGSGSLFGDPVKPTNSTPQDEFMSLLTLFPLLDLLLRDNIIASVSTGCRRGWKELFNSTDSSGHSNGIRALDAFGKLGAGYLDGNVFALGSYDECFHIPDTQYCLTNLTIGTAAVRYAFCLPQTCSEDDIRLSVNATHLSLQIRHVSLLLHLGSIRCERESQASYNVHCVVSVWCNCDFSYNISLYSQGNESKKREQNCRS